MNNRSYDRNNAWSETDRDERRSAAMGGNRQWGNDDNRYTDSNEMGLMSRHDQGRGDYGGPYREDRGGHRNDDMHSGRYGGGNSNSWGGTEYDRGGNFGSGSEGYEAGGGNRGGRNEWEPGRRDSYGSGRQSGQGSYGGGYGESTRGKYKQNEFGRDDSWRNEQRYDQGNQGWNDRGYGSERNYRNADNGNYNQSNEYGNGRGYSGNRNGERMGNSGQLGGYGQDYRSDSNRSSGRSDDRESYGRGTFGGGAYDPNGSGDRENSGNRPDRHQMNEWGNDTGRELSHGYGWGQRDNGNDRFWGSTDRETGRY